MKFMKFLYLILVVCLFFMIPFSGCGLLEDEDDPMVTNQVGDTLWVHNSTGDEYISRGPSLAYDHSLKAVYYPKSGGQINWTPTTIVAVDATTGVQKWTSPDLDHIGAGKLVIGDDGTIYVVGFYTLYAINPSNGQFKWTWEIPAELTNSDGNQVYTYGQIGGVSLLSSGDLLLGSGGSGTHARSIFNISSTGVMNWYNLDINGWGVISGITIDANDNAYYYAKQNDQTPTLYSIVGATGAVRWSKEFSFYNSADNNIIITPSGSLICSIALNAGEPFHMYQFNSSNGAIEWKSADEAEASTKLLGPDGKIYQYNWGGLVTFTSGVGQKTKFGDVNIRINGAVINSDNQLAMVHDISWVTNMVFYDQDATIDWNIAYDGMGGNVMIVTDDKKVIVYKAGGLVAFQGETTEAVSGWPSRYHDYRNTNNVSK